MRWVEGDGERRRRRHFAALAAVCSMLGFSEWFGLSITHVLRLIKCSAY